MLDSETRWVGGYNQQPVMSKTPLQCRKRCCTGEGNSGVWARSLTEDRLQHALLPYCCSSSEIRKNPATLSEFGGNTSIAYCQGTTTHFSPPYYHAFRVS
ncbi:uncharacterized protein DS421_8g233320 [Arachis hypogaea]|nr:uncharacterized protein DS421_8g233320 [Arachis hypogaea]